jgi:hypothetical protein
VQAAGQTSDGASEAAGEGGGMIAAITISCIGAACLLLLAVLWASCFIRLHISPDLLHAEHCRFCKSSLNSKELMVMCEAPGKSEGVHLEESRPHDMYS